MTVRIYKSTDAGAPAALPNTAGTLITVLDACLVNGYTGKAAAGWTKPFNGTNLGVYRQGVGSNGFNFRLDDAGGAIARVRGFEAMTTVDAGTELFPTDAQVSGGDYLFKHDGGAGSRPWVVVANEKAFYLWTQWNTNISGYDAGLTFFGDIKSRLSTDAFHTLLMAASGGTTKNANETVSCSDHGGAWGPMNQPLYGHFLARSYLQVSGSVRAGKRPESIRHTHGSYSRISSYGHDWPRNYFTPPFPSAVNGGVYLAPVVVHESAVQEDRGTMPGLWLIAHAHSGLTIQPGDTFNATAGYHAGKAFVVLPIYGGFYALETSDTW